MFGLGMDEDVGGFDVFMNDSMSSELVENLGQLEGDTEEIDNLPRSLFPCFEVRILL